MTKVRIEGTEGEVQQVTAALSHSFTLLPKEQSKSGELFHIVLELTKVEEATAREDDEEIVPIRETEWYRNLAPRMTPGKILRVYRDNAGLSLSKLAERCGIAKTNLSDMEHDKRAIGKVSAQKLGEALGIDYRRLL